MQHKKEKKRGKKGGEEISAPKMQHFKYYRVCYISDDL